MRSEISNKKFRFVLIFLCPIVFLVSFILCSSSFALTPEEAKTLYKELDCQIISSETCEKGLSCKGLFDVALYHDSSWDETVIESEPIPDPNVCIPEWCSLPVQDCSLPPLTGGKDSCGEPCSKPSEIWKNCIHTDGTIGPIE